MQIDLLGGSYQHRFRDWNSQRTVNWLPKIADQKEKNKTSVSLVPRPGLSQHADLSSTAVRGLFTARTRTQERLRCLVVETDITHRHRAAYHNRNSVVVRQLP